MSVFALTVVCVGRNRNIPNSVEVGVLCYFSASVLFPLQMLCLVLRCASLFASVG